MCGLTVPSYCSAALGACSMPPGHTVWLVSQKAQRRMELLPHCSVGRSSSSHWVIQPAEWKLGSYLCWERLLKFLLPICLCWTWAFEIWLLFSVREQIAKWSCSIITMSLLNSWTFTAWIPLAQSYCIHFTTATHPPTQLYSSILNSHPKYHCETSEQLPFAIYKGHGQNIQTLSHAFNQFSNSLHW